MGAGASGHGSLWMPCAVDFVSLGQPLRLLPAWGGARGRQLALGMQRGLDRRRVLGMRGQEPIVWLH